ncbi:hypothetical protein LCGC14_2086900 [marine sediment metagenome]|uniref:Uncharacterized protein n=1 Tax=marine sediment metagenome TaxID=412755 RepID=A0A0F9HAX0_9ZZZZ
MSTPVGARVLAVRDGKEGTLHVYGRGIFVGHERPPGDWPEGYTNPKIELDGGGVAWGNQCWWGPLEQWEAKYGVWEWLDVPLPAAEEPEAT